jgi:hypothetical protein
MRGRVLLVAGMAAIVWAAGASGSEARVRRGGFGVFYVAAGAGAARAATKGSESKASERAPVVRTASAEDGPVPTTTGTTVPTPAPAPAPVAAAKPAKPWCAGRVFGSGSGFCEIN